MHAIAFRLIRVIFWAALALHLGGLVAIGAAAAPAVFSTLRDVKAQVPPETNPLNWENQLGAEVFGNVLSNLRLIEIAAIIGMAVALAAESFLLRGAMLRKLGHWARIALLVVVAGLVAWDGLVLSPQIHAKRTEWRNSGAADGPHRAEFRVLHERALALGHTKIYLLLGIVAVTVLTSTVVPAMLPQKLKPVVEPPVAAKPSA